MNGLPLPPREDGFSPPLSAPLKGFASPALGCCCWSPPPKGSSSAPSSAAPRFWPAASCCSAGGCPAAGCSAAASAPFCSVVVPVEALGLDINRPGVHMLTFSEPILLPPYLLRLCQKYRRLEDVIRQLGKAVTRATIWRRRFPSVFSFRYYTKMTGELARVHAARARCLAELHRASTRFVSSVLVQTGHSLLCVEDLHASARNTRGALAKAILAMPDQETLYPRAVLLASYITGRPIALRKVNPAYTSQGIHRDCSGIPPGRIVRHPGQ